MGKAQSRHKDEKGVLEKLVEEFKVIYKEKGPHDLRSQIPYLEKMADQYQSRSDWTSLLRVCLCLLRLFQF